ncbi:hypothetical protein [Sphingomonas phyllosphaerae]|nr:hypothetical protein [Sphingomonas phyllosphaerae]
MSAELYPARAAPQRFASTAIRQISIDIDQQIWPMSSLDSS